MRSVAGWILLVCAVSQAGCLDHVEEELQRVRSPDGLVEAFIIRTSSFLDLEDDVYLAVPGSGNRSRSVFNAQPANGLRLVWRENQVLQIEYESAQVYGFRNFFETHVEDGSWYWVEIRLAPTRDHSLNWNEDTLSNPQGRKRMVFQKP